MPVEVVLRPEAEEDFRALPTSAAQLDAAGLLIRLESNPYLGQELGDKPPGDLSDCRKLYFDDRRYRIVYRLSPSSRAPTAVDVIAIGPREAMEVYETALARLGRAE
jgi:hypothetical protein